MSTSQEDHTIDKTAKNNLNIANLYDGHVKNFTNADIDSVAFYDDNAETEAFYENVFEKATLDKVDLNSGTLKKDSVSKKTFEEFEKHYKHALKFTPERVMLITTVLSNEKMSGVYNVNGSTFVDDDTLSKNDDDSLVEYELYKVMKMEKDEENMTAQLDIQIQHLPQGVIINSNVFLWTLQWHTMVLVDGDLYRCAVCQTYCDRVNCDDHIETIAHLRNLDRYKPLKRFDLSIVRKINENLHCGVCNEIFDVIDCITHEGSKTHEGNILTAINKVSDLMYDSDIHNASNGRNFKSNNRNTNSMAVQNYDRNAFYNDRSSNRNIVENNYARNVLTPEHRNNNNEYHFDANAINSSEINVYEEFSGSEEEYDNETEAYNTPCQGISYASMASKPSIELPKYMKIDLGTKEVRVEFESWHMIIRMKSNKFYCMVCNKQDHIRFKSQHCISCEHVERLARCTVVQAYEDFLIRKVDEKLYHCGHCNNLQFQNQMNEHIERAHPRKSKNILDTANNSKSAKKPAKTNAKNSNKDHPGSKNNTAIEKVDNNQNIESKVSESQVDSNFDIFGEVTIAPFGSEMKISAFSLHFIMIKNEYYYCAVCDKTCADVKSHLEDLDHRELMAMTPFIRPFKCNLTRAVRGTLHCSLCNKLLMVHDIYTHNMDQPHTTALAKALGMKRTQKSDTNEQKIDFTKPTKLEVCVEQNPAAQRSNSPMLPPYTVKPSHTSETQKPINPQQVKKDSNSGNILPTYTSNTACADQQSAPKTDTIENTFYSRQSDQNAHSNTGSNFGLKPPLAQAGQNYQNTGPNMLYPVQNLNSAQNFPPLIYNFRPPTMIPMNSQNPNAQFLGPPTNYNHFNAAYPSFPFTPRATLPPNFQNITTTIPNQNSYKPTNQNNANAPIQKQGETKWKENTGAKKNIEPSSDAIKSGNDKIRSGNENIKSGNDTIEFIGNQSYEEEEKELDEEELVFIKLKTTYFKITNFSYNTLVYLDNGIRYCFVCSTTVFSTVLRKHVDSREHAENVAKTKFLDKYGVQLFRQMYLMYHCAICNELMTRREIKLHLDWADHVESYDCSHVILTKKNRKRLKSGVKEYVVETQKEAIFHNVNEPKINLIVAYQVMAESDANKDFTETKPAECKTNMVKKNKMVILNNVVMKVNFDHWHSITTSKNVTKCIICQLEIKPDEVNFDHCHSNIEFKDVTKRIIYQMKFIEDEILEHVETDYHGVALGRTFEKAYYPALIRKINDSLVNCLICNLELSNNESMVHEHVNGRKHNKNQENVINETSNSDSYTDCYEEYLNI